MQTISVETLREWLEEERPVSILDVRTQAERSEWAIPGSVHIDAYDALKAHDPRALSSFVAPRDRPIVTVCGSGKVSKIAVEQLASQGLQVYSLAGGMKAWSLAWNIAESVVPESDAHVIQVRRTGKGCLSYIIGAHEEAIVIDASLDPQVYLALASHHGWQIRYVFDTHIHADHLSRSRQLAQQSGAMLFLPAQQRVSFPYTAMQDGNTVQAASLSVTALHTPGHTAESTCYLVNNRLLFTGDTLFLDGVGRPDLQTTQEEVQSSAEALYQSLHTLLSLPAETVVLPGHTSHPIPFDGIPLQATLSKIAEQSEMLHLSRADFVQTILFRLPATPPNYDQIVRLNEQGLFPEVSPTELEAGANRCAIS